MPATKIFIMARGLQQNVNDYDKLTKSKPSLKAPHLTLDAFKRSLFACYDVNDSTVLIVCSSMKLRMNLCP